MSAQATRDAKENQVREDALTEMRAKLNLFSGADTVIDRLATAYRSGGAGAGTPEYEKLCTDLKPSNLKPTNAEGFRDLVNTSMYGDPEHWPGLTAPAVDALAAHLQATSDGGDEEGSNGRVFRAQRVFRARTMTASVREYGNSLEQYERLAPVLKGLAALLHHLPPHEDGTPAARPMAELLRDAPTEALDGPLQPLVQAFRQRILRGEISFEERTTLRGLSKGSLFG